MAILISRKKNSKVHLTGLWRIFFINNIICALMYLFMFFKFEKFMRILRIGMTVFHEWRYLAWKLVLVCFTLFVLLQKYYIYYSSYEFIGKNLHSNKIILRRNYIRSKLFLSTSIPYNYSKICCAFYTVSLSNCWVLTLLFFVFIWWQGSRICS